MLRAYLQIAALHATGHAVGGLSLINAIAGAYSEDLPIICIVGGPNSNDYGTNRILHHTIGVADFNQARPARDGTCMHVIMIALAWTEASPSLPVMCRLKSIYLS